MTEYNFRHQTKMMSIGLAAFERGKASSFHFCAFCSLFSRLAAQPPGSGPASARLTGYFSHETLLGRAAVGGVRQGGLCGRLT
ncbi:hypothetical protein V1283_006277 [Bradyrhizobium sp. AZCC 2262]|uniref:hypothetical protein n=1 Tax=Bradyrhizobium sp. AZCC 2262 TaxID=3117022 RepID=UPI002FEFE9E4